jgi:integrase/recombinase XerD
MTSSQHWDELQRQWLHGRAESTQGTYGTTMADFRAFIKDRPIRKVDLKLLQDYVDSTHKKQRTVRRQVSTVRSIFKFAEEMGLIKYNPARALRAPKVPNGVASKILEAKQILAMIAQEPNKRNAVLLRVLYAAGLRASEAASLCWEGVQPRGEKGGQITVLGKGSKSRTILLSHKTWDAILSIKPADADPKLPVFLSREGEKKPLKRTTISNIVGAAARRVGITLNVSAHWMRHGHATHALDNGVPLLVISQTLGHTNIATTNSYLHVRPNESSATGLGV